MIRVPRFRLPFRTGRRDPGSWSLVSTVKGEPETILPFVAYHLTLGCEAIHFYLDGPHRQVEALLASLDRVQITVCDDAYWAAQGGKPNTPGMVACQMINYRHARVRIRSEWLIHIDNDEFLYPEGGGEALAAELAACPPDIDWLRLPPFERVLLAGQPQESLCDGQFRSVAPDAATAKRIYGADLRFLHLGFSGHIRGKTALRTRSPLVPRIHEAVWPGRQTRRVPSEDMLPPFHVTKSTRLLHFDGWTAQHWVAKLSGRKPHFMQPLRQRQSEYITTASSAEGKRELFHRLQCVSPERARMMRAHRMLHDIGFDPGPAIAAVFPGLDLSLSAAEFDRRRAAAAPPG